MTQHKKQLQSCSGQAGAFKSLGVTLLRTRTLSLALVIIAFSLATWNADKTGERWLDDGPRYCNNGAMFHDLIQSGNWFNPIEFAKQNYIKYPAHSVPYHPPGYALMLGIWFCFFGMSYFAARCMIGLLFGLSVGIFFNLLTHLGLPKKLSWLGALMLALAPEMSVWSQTMMSEVPGMFFVLLCTYFFVRHEESSSPPTFALSLLFAICAFFCKIQTAGVLPALFIYVTLDKGWKTLLKPRYVAFTAFYTVMAITWIKFAGSYSVLEMRSKIPGVSAVLNVENWLQWLLGFPEIIGIPAAISLLVFASILLIRREFNLASRASSFFLLWLLAVYLFEAIRGSHYEARYLFYAIPPAFGLIATFIHQLQELKSRRYSVLATMSIYLILISNFIFYTELPSGLVGYGDVSKSLASNQIDGNIVISVPHDSDLIFRLRANAPEYKYQVLRGDRIFAIRLAGYTMEPSILLCKDHDDILDAISRGNPKFVITADHILGDIDRRPAEMRLCHQAVSNSPDRFALINTHSIHRTSDRYPNYEISIWENTRHIPGNKSLLPITIPTAKLSLSVAE